MAAEPRPAGVPSSSYKDDGNAEFKAGNYLKAAALYTKGIKEDPENAVLYSNRSASFMQLNKHQKALADAEECVRLRPDWEKGSYRLGAALAALGRTEEALAALEESRRLSSEPSKDLEARIRALKRGAEPAQGGGGETKGSAFKF